MKRKTAVLSILVALTCTIWAQSPKHEVRAVWLTTIGGIDWPRSHKADQQKKEMVRILDQLREAGINTVLLQTRVRASTIYPSAIEPWDMCLTGRHGQSPGYDPLKFCIDECHRRGMELHAWIVTIPVGKLSEQRCKEFQKRNPQIFRKIGDAGYMNPESPETGDYLAKICREVVHNYDVDGIHLDYIRYPETWKLKVSKQQGRQNITAIVRKIHKAVKREKPWVKLSCSPVGKHGDLARYKSGGWNAYNAVCQDAQGWMREGLMDQIYPMQYFRDNHFFPFALDWKEQSDGRAVASGLGIYFLHPKEGKWQLSDVSRQMYVVREAGIGHCFFRSKFLTDNTKGIYNFTKSFNRTPALVPPMKTKETAAPTPPEKIAVKPGKLLWTAAKRIKDSPNLLYNIYASDTYPVDITKAENLVGCRVQDTCVSIPERPVRYYAVCTTDRYGQESLPRQMQREKSGFESRLDIEKTDGQWLSLPPKGRLDAEFIAIEDLQGRLVATLPYSEGKQVSIAHLKDGIYVIRSLGRKGVSHRIGYFSIKRQR